MELTIIRYRWHDDIQERQSKSMTRLSVDQVYDLIDSSNNGHIVIFAITKTLNENTVSINKHQQVLNISDIRGVYGPDVTIEEISYDEFYENYPNL